ncbi:MAG: hypothetical protein AAB562_00935 [Patescibacteria group bacterium]
MKGEVKWWNPRQGWGRIKGTSDGATYFFLTKWVEPGAQDRKWKRGETVAFDGDRTAKGRVAYRVRPA